MQQTSLKKESASRAAMLALVVASTAVSSSLHRGIGYQQNMQRKLPSSVTEHGCVGESKIGQSVVVSDCSAGVGDVISAKFYAPAASRMATMTESMRSYNGGTIGSLFVFDN